MYCRVLKSVSTKNGVGLIFRRFLSSEKPLLSELAKNSLIHTENDGYVIKSPYEPISIPEFTVDQYVWKNMPKWQNHIAVQCGVTGRKYKYAKLRDHCAALAIRLRNSLKLEKGDIVGICLPNVPGKVLTVSLKLYRKRFIFQCFFIFRVCHSMAWSIRSKFSYNNGQPMVHKWRDITTVYQ